MFTNYSLMLNIQCGLNCLHQFILYVCAIVFNHKPTHIQPNREPLLDTHPTCKPQPSRKSTWPVFEISVLLEVRLLLVENAWSPGLHLKSSFNLRIYSTYMPYMSLPRWFTLPLNSLSAWFRLQQITLYPTYDFLVIYERMLADTCYIFLGIISNKKVSNSWN